MDKKETENNKKVLYGNLLLTLFDKMKDKGIDVFKFVDYFIKASNEASMIMKENKEKADIYIDEQYKRMNPEEQFYCRILSLLLSLASFDKINGVDMINRAYHVHKKPIDQR